METSDKIKLEGENAIVLQTQWKLSLT